MKRAAVLLLVLTLLLTAFASPAGGAEDDWLGEDYDEGLEWDELDADAEEDLYGGWDGIGEDEEQYGPGAGVAGGTYTYDVDGYAITCRTNVDSYIDGNVFRLADLARDLGWHTKYPEDANDPDWVAYCLGEEHQHEVMFDYRSDRHFYRIMFTINGGHSSGGRNGRIDFLRHDVYSGTEDTYRVNRGGYYDVNREQIIMYTYLMESIMDDPDADPLGNFSYYGVFTIDR